MAVDEEKWQKILEELKSSEIKDCVPCAEELKKKIQSLNSDVLDFLTYVVKSLPSKKPETDQDNQAADNRETSQPDRPEAEDAPDDMDPKSEPPAAENMETSPSQPDCSKETFVNREEEEEEQPAVSLQAAESNSGQIKKRLHSSNDTELSSNNQSDSHHQKKIQEEKMAVYEEKCPNIQREKKSSEIKDCVPRAENGAKKAIQPHDAVGDSLPPKKPRTATSLFPTVTFFCVVTGETFGAHKTIVEKVEKRQWTSTTWVERTESVQECDIIIVFCTITSRIGSDVEAVKKHAAVSSNNKPVIVVLMHHTRDEEFPPGERKWFDDRRFVLEVHVLYHETQRGLLQCAQNDQAVSKIQQELFRHSKSLWSLS